MIVLGVGTNIGDRLANLRRALQALQLADGISIEQVSPVYMSDALLPDNAPADWDLPYLNIAIRCETTLQPLALLALLKKIELSFGRAAPVRHWGPRIIDIDILAWDEKIITSDELTIPKVDLLERPFALWPLADVAPRWVFPSAGAHQGKTAEQLVEKWRSRFTGDAPLHTRQIYQRIDTSQLVGIINVTPDSFSDGNQFYHPETAIHQALHLISSGAEIIDIGAESTSPKAQPITAQTEWERLEPILKLIQTEKGNFILPPKISIDTRHAEVAEKALAFEIDWINDVSGLDDPAMRSIVAEAQVDCVVMHHIRIPEDRNVVLARADDPVTLVYEWCAKRLDDLEQAGISREKIIFDPGIGFGKMAEQSLLLIKHIDYFSQLGTRLLVGPSRKTFLSLFTQYEFSERDIETLPIILYLAKHHVDYLRVHNVEMCARGLRVMQSISDNTLGNNSF